MTVAAFVENRLKRGLLASLDQAFVQICKMTQAGHGTNFGQTKDSIFTRQNMSPTNGRRRLGACISALDILYETIPTPLRLALG